MFIKIPVYFEILGTIRELELVQEGLSLWLEQTLLGRKTKLELDLPWKKLFPKNVETPGKILLIKRDRVISGLK